MELFKRKYINIDLIEKNDLSERYVAINSETNEEVGLHILRNQSNDLQYINNIIKDVNQLKDLKHESLIGVNEISSFKEDNNTYYYIETEHFQSRTLWNRVFFSKRTYRQNLEIIKQLSDGLKEFHYRGINYETLNIENVFMNKEGVIKLDVASYILQKYDESEEFTYCDNFEDGVDRDLCALGIILYQLITRDCDFKLNKLIKTIDEEAVYSMLYSLTTKKSSYRYESLNGFLLDLNICIESLPMDNIDLEEIDEIDMEENNTSKSKKSILIKRLCACSIALLVLANGVVRGIEMFNKKHSKNNKQMELVKYDEVIDKDILEEEVEPDITDQSQVATQDMNTYANDYNSNNNIDNGYNNNVVETPNYDNTVNNEQNNQSNNNNIGNEDVNNNTNNDNNNSDDNTNNDINDGTNNDSPVIPPSEGNQSPDSENTTPDSGEVEEPSNDSSTIIE